MDEDTTTGADVQEQTGAPEASPVSQEQTETADVQTDIDQSDASQDTNQGDETVSESEPDDKLRKYAASQGFELDSPGAIKAAQIAMKAQSAATRNSKRANELEKATVSVADQNAEAEATVTGQDPELLKRLQRVEVRESVRDFWSNPEHDRQMETKMVEVLENKPYLAGDLDSLYAVALVQTGGINAVKSQGKKEALSELAHQQQAAVPRGNATTHSNPKEKDFKDLSLKEMEAKLGFAKR